MSLLITGSVGLVPISELVAGAAVQISLDGTLLVAGCGMALLCVVSLLSRSVRNLGLEPPIQAGAPVSGVTVAGDAAGA